MAKLTKRNIEALQTRDAEYFVSDSELPGFGIRVAPSGRKTFALRYRINGSQRRFKIGPFGPLTAEDARKRAKQLLGEVASGGDPSRSRKATRDDPTIRVLSKRYIEEYAEKQKKTADEDRAKLDRYVLPRLGSLRVSAVRRRDVIDLHREISRKYPIGANRVLALVSKMFSLAVLWELRSDNPATKIPKNPENRREVFLSSADLAGLGKVLREAETAQSESIYAVAAIRLLLFTGCRRNEILGLRWPEVDFEHGVLRLSDSKTGSRIVQLNAPALKILVHLRNHQQRDLESPLVIQGKFGGTRQLAIQPPWQRIRESAGLGGVRLHDLRHTHASVAAQRGESLIVIGSLLGHRAPATTARYAHLSDDPRRAASERTAADISAAMDADFEEVAPAIPLRR